MTSVSGQDARVIVDVTYEQMIQLQACLTDHVRTDLMDS